MSRGVGRGCGQDRLIPRSERAGADNRLWALPGGAQHLGESIVEAVVREIREETGILIEVAGLVGVYSDPGHVIAYDDGEVRQEFSICVRGLPSGGTLAGGSESKGAHWVEVSELEQLRVHPAVRLRIEHGLQRSPQSYLG